MQLTTSKIWLYLNPKRERTSKREKQWEGWSSFYIMWRLLYSLCHYHHSLLSFGRFRAWTVEIRRNYEPFSPIVLVLSLWLMMRQILKEDKPDICKWLTKESFWEDKTFQFSKEFRIPSHLFISLRESFKKLLNRCDSWELF